MAKKVKVFLGILIVFVLAVFIVLPQVNGAAEMLGEYYKWHKYCFSGKVNFNTESINGHLQLKAICLQKNNTIAWQGNCWGHFFTRTSSLNDHLNIVTCYEEPSAQSRITLQKTYVRDWESTCKTTLQTRMLGTDSFDATCLSNNMGWTRLCSGQILVDKDDVLSREGSTITRAVCFKLR